jgi:hypothetical protein
MNQHTTIEDLLEYPGFQATRHNIKLALYKALIRSVMVYACPAWEYEADAHLSKLKHKYNQFLHAIGNFDRHTPVHKMHMAFRILYMYSYIIKPAGNRQK